ncbi:MAG: hypothetical protein P0Y53_22125 [Candidatus Pseudobacter hemicellulosilyticus]|uniref:Uncharacterized protein n=1 Tax=Candidatus Pseudobacter hemicellulosilyticus TaxID=3121375 RepID=A0AAJ6BHI0_9BACT|nr:MAG: hypothetical protein P0Y53_22125 [Pseudobacter sp.]
MSRTMAAFLLLLTLQVSAQDTLPRFSVTTRGNNKVIVSWTNNYPVITQLSIQRSTDSTRNFRTILTLPDPTVKQNGYVDTKSPTPFSFYRLFIVLENGNYVFSESRRPFWDTAGASPGNATAESAEINGRRVVIADNMPYKEAEQLKEKLTEVVQKEVVKEPAKPEAPRAVPGKKPEPEKLFTVKRRDSILVQLTEKNFKRFRDSVVSRTKDTIAFKNLDTIVIRPFVPKEIYRPSRFVYTDKDGNVVIALPEAPGKDYQVKFFEDDRLPLFSIKKVKEPLLVMDKSNFLHAGWFQFELYEEGKLKETHKFLIPKDF